MRHAAPIEQAVGQGFDIGQDARASGGKAGHGLENAVDQGEVCVPDERERPEQRGGNPAKGDDAKPFAKAKVGATAEPDGDAASQHGDDR